MDPFSLIVIGGAVAGVAVLLDAMNNQNTPSPRERTRDEIRRIGDETIVTLRQTSKDFRDHIDRQTGRR